MSTLKQSTAPARTDRSPVLFTCKLSGFTHYEGALLASELEVGQHLELKSEPNNPIDRRAIAIFLKGKKLGYIPTERNAFISTALLYGHDIFECIINRIDFRCHPEEQVGIVVRVKDVKK